MSTRGILAASAALAITLSGFADTVILRNGSKVDGTIVSTDSKQVILRDAKGNFRTFERAEVTKVEVNDRGKQKAAADAAPAKPAEAVPEKPADAAPASDLTEVLAIGTGKDPDAARKDALRQAVSQVVGSLVVASDVVANDELIDSKILTYSDGYVERFEPVGEPTSKDGLVRVKIRAWVRQGKLTKALADNKVPVKDVDLRSMQGQSETLAQQARSAEEVVAALLEGFPEKVLVVEPLAPVRVDGDETHTVFEVPLRVKVDSKKWAAFVDEAKRVLDPIAEAKGSENWNARVAGWYSLAGPVKAATSTTKGSKASSGDKRGGASTGEPEVVSKIRGSYIFERLVPAGDRASAVVAANPDGRSVGDVPQLKIAAERKRVFGILDKFGGKVIWWQLPRQSWEVATSAARFPIAEVRVENADGEQIATPVLQWREAIPGTKPGEPDKVMVGAGEFGERHLAVGAPNVYGQLSFDRWACYGCQVRFDQQGQSFQPELPRGDHQFPKDAMSLLVPCGAGRWRLDYFSVPFLAPTMTFPRRFSIPGSMAQLQSDFKVTVELEKP